MSGCTVLGTVGEMGVQDALVTSVFCLPVVLASSGQLSFRVPSSSLPPGVSHLFQHPKPASWGQGGVGYRVPHYPSPGTDL